MKQQEPVATAKRSYTAVYERDPETGSVIVTFPAIPDLSTYGEDMADAPRMAVECLQGYLETLHRVGDPLPPPEGHGYPVLGREAVEVSLKSA